MRPRRILQIFALCVAALAIAATANAVPLAESSFLNSLSPAEKQAAGIDHLTAEQQATLDNLVDRETRLAQQGGVSGFASDFTRRRSAPELAKAGLDKLSDTQRATINTLVARRLAAQPTVSTQSLAAQSYSSTGQIGIKPEKPKLETHGTVSFTVGSAGGGRNFYGGGVEVEEVDPVHGLSISVGYSEFHGKGIGPWCAYGPYGRPYWW